MISLWNVEHAAQELERCRKEGLRGATIGLVPAEDLLYGSDHYERFWAACQDLAMLVNLHINSGPGRMKFSPQQRSGLMPDGAAGHKWFPGFAMRGCILVAEAGRRYARTVMAESIRVSIDGIADAEACRLATERAREAAILELYRLGQISSGQAAHDLSMSRVEFLDLANRHRIPTIQITAEELEEELGSLGL